MIRKVILLSILFLNILYGATLETKAQHLRGENVIINFNDMTGQNQDWIGIYPRESSNSWNNVLKWAWTKDTLNGQVSIKDLPIGRYEARAFYNNNFQLKARQTFNVVEIVNNDINLDRLGPYFLKGNLQVQLMVKRLAPINHKPKDWVGLYKKDASNSWSNVIKWTWAKDYVISEDTRSGPNISFGKVNLEAGEYEVRYFLNNSFTTYRAEAFTVGNDDVKLRRLEISFFNRIVNVRFIATIWEEGIHPNPKDWVGIYKKDTSNSWDNVIQWGWVKDRLNQGIPPEYLSFNNLPAGEYEARYFLNNSFKTYMTADFKVQ
jgi:hypothetical protein